MAGPKYTDSLPTLNTNLVWGWWVQGLGFWGFGVYKPETYAQLSDSGMRVRDWVARCEVLGFGFWVLGFGFWVLGFG